MFKVIKQHELQDCGAACLSMICTCYGLNQPLSKYRELVRVDNDGTNILGIVKGAEQLGLIPEALKGDSKELLEGINSKEVKVPFIAHVITKDYLEHFIVVYKITQEAICVADPAVGNIKYSYEEFFDIWSGHIITFELSDSFKKANLNNNVFKLFTLLLNTHKKQLFCIVMISVVITAISIISSFTLQIIVDGINNQLPFSIFNNTLSVVCIGIMLLFLIKAGLSLVRSFFLCRLSSNIGVSLMMNYYDHLMDLPVGQINKHKTGDLISRFTDSSDVRNALASVSISLILDTMMIVIVSIILYFINDILFYYSLGFILIYAIISILFLKPIKVTNKEVMENNAEVIAYLKESIDGIETVKVYNAEGDSSRKTKIKVKKLFSSFLKGVMVINTQSTLTGFIASVGTLILLWLGSELVIEKFITVGGLLTFYSLFMYLLDSVQSLIELQPEVQTAIVATERLNDLLELDTENGTKSEIECGDIEIQNLDFRYGYRDLVLKKIDMRIKKGTTIALVGESGSGKTTLSKLLMGFYRPERGRITIGDTDITKVDPKCIRNQISYVSQNIYLFSDTIKNNLLIGKPDATMEEIDKVCKMAKVYEFIQELPLGYNTLIGENGVNLSGGQKQRLAIARALLKNPKILILDEATSNLDSITESGIKNVIEGLKGEITCIIIAHRLSIIKNCDAIYVMQNGMIVEEGTHDELLDKKKLYYKFYYENQR